MVCLGGDPRKAQWRRRDPSQGKDNNGCLSEEVSPWAAAPGVSGKSCAQASELNC